MDYRITAKRGLLILFSLYLHSCGIGEKKHPEVDGFYTQKRYGQQFALLPLAKPVTMGYDTDNERWGFHDSSNIYGFSLHGADTDYIGVNGQYVYGKVVATETTNDKLEPDDIVYAVLSGGSTWTKEPKVGGSDVIAIPVQGKPNTYLLPERWFIINTTDEKVDGFFDQAEYSKALKNKGIEGRMFKTDSLLKAYQETGLLEYFPDSIKTKLRQ